MVKKIIEEPFSERDLSPGKKVAFLKEPASYPHPVNSVEAIETHMSWVFLAGGFVYKLKKPVKYDLLDLRNLESRFRNCREEVQLNKRLAADIYLDIMPLTVDEKGNPALQGKGTIVDWLVRMKRIPGEQMLDHAIRHHAASEMRLKKAATLLVEFYKMAPPVLTEAQQYREKLKAEINTVYKELINPAYKLPAVLVNTLTSGLLQFLTGHFSLLDNRVAGGKIIEAHGDLRPEHICLGPEPAIIDCLEFNRELRILDIAEELSFLAMECEFMGDESAGVVFFDTYASLTSDLIPGSLISFYKLKRACLRAYLVARHIAEAVYKEDPKWLAKANAYLQLADHYNQQLPD